MDIIEQLTAIQKNASWTQVELAHALEVSHATLNSWLRGRSTPRKAAQDRIAQLNLKIVGSAIVDDDALAQTKDATLEKTFDLCALAQNTDALNAFTLQLTYHTNTIEGSAMTLGDVEAVLFDDKVLANRSAIEQREAQNHRAALLWLIDQINSNDKPFAFSEELILNLHLRLMHGIITNAGTYRNHSARIVGAHVPLANHVSVPQKMRELIPALNGSGKDLIHDIAATHARFEQIHPFSDGNGRCGRLLMFAQAASQHHYPPLVVKERKHAYYRYLEAAQANGDSRPLELFVADSMMFTADLLVPYGVGV